MHWPIAWREHSVACFVAAFESIRYEQCANGDVEYGWEKVAIYVDAADKPQHMARQEGCGVIWTSKLGDFEDITHHTLRGVEGAAYGAAKYFMRRRR